MAKNIMIQGTMSNVGKSLLAAGLCRILSRTAIVSLRLRVRIWRQTPLLPKTVEKWDERK